MNAESELDSLRFLNVDVDVRSSEAGKLVEYLEGRAIIMSSGRDYLSFEHLEQFESADLCALALASLIRGMPPDIAERWRRSEKRCFDIGFVMESQALPATATLLSYEAVDAIRAVGGELRLSLYSASNYA